MDNLAVNLADQIVNLLSPKEAFSLIADYEADYSDNLDIVNKVNKKYQPFLTATNWFQIFFGGSSSGKSVFLAQRCVKDLMAGGRNYLIIRNVSDSIRDSVFKEIKKVISDWGLSDYFRIRETNMDVTCKNGYQVLFKGLNDVERLKSITPEKGVITDIWVEEATETAENDIKQLLKRLRGGDEETEKRVTLSFNPINKTHWIYKKYFNNYIEGQDYDTPELLIVHSTYKDNAFLTAQDIHGLENEKDKYFYDVYTLGKWGVLGDLIFKNWSVIDIKHSQIFKTFDRFRHGLDFGYSNDPTAYNRMYYHSATKSLYIVDEVHKLAATNDVIAQEIKPFCGNDSVSCDSAEPKSIAELRKYGINATPALKGKDSITHGIQWLQQLKIYIDISCQETKNEFEMYQWQKNKDGEVLNVPIDKFNHHIDSIRYATEDLSMASNRYSREI
jgi:phage terminase large subunit